MRRPIVRQWTDTERSILREMVAAGGSKIAIAARLKRTLPSIEREARRLGLDLKRMKATFSPEALAVQHRTFGLGQTAARQAAPAPATPVEVSAEEAFSPENMAGIRAYLEKCDSIDTVSPDLRRIVEENWPDLVEKLPPEAD